MWYHYNSILKGDDEMIKDIHGNKRYKINLHTHTTLSDGRKAPEESAEIYKNAGYDAIAFTDHWKFGAEREVGGLKIFAGVEYDFGLDTTEERVYHIVALFCERDPLVERSDTPQTCIDKINAAGGIAVLAHPAWSLNHPDEVAELSGVFHTEIYNTVSGIENSFRPYSGLFVDLLACKGKPMHLIAADDTHYYTDDAAVASVMVKCDSLDRESVMEAIKNGDFYATTGPEVHIRVENGETVVECSPVSKIEVCTNAAFCRGRRLLGNDLTSHRAPLHKVDKYVRAEVTDAEGRTAYSNFIIAERDKDKVKNG